MKLNLKVTASILALTVAFGTYGMDQVDNNLNPASSPTTQIRTYGEQFGDVAVYINNPIGTTLLGYIPFGSIPSNIVKVYGGTISEKQTLARLIGDGVKGCFNYMGASNVINFGEQIKAGGTQSFTETFLLTIPGLNMIFNTVVEGSTSDIIGGCAQKVVNSYVPYGSYLTKATGLGAQTFFGKNTMTAVVIDKITGEHSLVITEAPETEAPEDAGPVNTPVVQPIVETKDVIAQTQPLPTNEVIGNGVVYGLNMLGLGAITKKTGEYAQLHYNKPNLTSAFLGMFTPAKTETTPIETVALPQVSALSNNLSTFIVDEYQQK